MMVGLSTRDSRDPDIGNPRLPTSSIKSCGSGTFRDGSRLHSSKWSVEGGRQRSANPDPVHHREPAVNPRSTLGRLNGEPTSALPLDDVENSEPDGERSKQEGEGSLRKVWLQPGTEVAAKQPTKTTADADSPAGCNGVR